MKFLAGTVITLLILTIACGPGEPEAPAYVEDIVAAAPDNAELLLENDNLAAKRFTVPPQAELPMHPAKARIIYSLSDYKLKVTSRGYPGSVSNFRKGQIEWKGAGTHSVQNVGPITAEYLVIESIGQNPTAGVTSNIAELTPDKAKVILETQQTKVIEVTLEPGDKQPEHDAASRLIYSLTPAKLSFTTADGTVETEFAEGDAHYHDGGKHSVENIGDAQVRYLVVELM